MTPTFQDEVQLAGWSETHTGGAKVTFWLPDTSALDVFRTLTARKGNTAGHRFACVLVEIGDDEQPVITSESASEVKEKQQKGGEWAKLAGMWCADTDFWAFCNSREWSASTVGNAQDAGKLVRDVCGIDSRAALDHDPTALARFNQFFRHDFMTWMQARGISK